MSIEVLSPYYPIYVCFLAAGAYLLIRVISVMESYELLVKNEEHINGLVFRFTKRLRNKINEL